MQPLVLFDLDNTLVDRQCTLAEWAGRFQARHGLSPGSERWLIGLLADRATPAHFARVRERFVLDESVGALWNRYCSDIAAAVVCPQEVLSGLEGLRADGWRIGVATNGAADIQWAKLRATRIADHVDAVCISEEIGVRKPDPAMFHEAVRRCGAVCDGAGIWMVGDSPVNDIGGGQAAGLRTVWISRGRPWPGDLLPPDRQVAEARAAIDLLAAAGSVRNVE
ncbi:HAD family hydrolase [Peterkaempfera bronchialis]|uniref:HAD family hydrolase n=1 Tax=Peterkaempfera bronchialis TaxID=2126346 RepID=A0A345SSX5_9ACTN|nr:HAD family hydrolase [Peterkaempfera bronchialis]AXI76830.1 HAD family hydrolase [Peterkaempfera bronchialis]